MVDVMKMKRERQKAIDELRAISSAAEAREDKRMTTAEGEKWSALDVEIKRMADEIARAERMNELEGETAGGGNRGEHQTEKKFAGLGEFLQAVRSASVPGGKIDSRLIESRAADGMSEVNPADGGFLVQTDQMAEIMKRTYEVSALANRCRRIPIGAGANGLSWLSFDETSRATGSRFGGVRGYWAAEASTATATQPKFKRSRLDLEKLMAFVYMTDELLQDTTGMESLASQVVGEEFAWLLDEAIQNGTGAGQPLGWMNSDAIVSVGKETGQTAATIVYENIIKMWSRMWSRSRQNAIWVVNQDCEPQLQTMALVVGAGGVPVFMPSTTASPTQMLMGRPIVAIEQAKTCGTTGDISLVDLSQYILIDKGGIKNDMSIHVKFMYDESVFRFTYRINGQPTWDAPLTPANGTSNTLSPFVKLDTRA